VLALGAALLAARPALVQVPGVGHPTALLLACFALLLVVGIRMPLPAGPVPVDPTRAARPATRAVVLAVGIGAFALGRLVVGGEAPAPATAFWILANVLAAVAEEAWFRRLCFGTLAPAGVGFAVVGSALLFALVHVGIYGIWVLPLDLAAGLVLGWQRAATGSWLTPAATHAVANLLMIL
jgi:membrane protease YdiL (CAAX protease family)